MKIFWSILILVICSSCANQDKPIIKDDPIIEKTGPSKDGSIVPNIWLQRFYLDNEINQIKRT